MFAYFDRVVREVRELTVFISGAVELDWWCHDEFFACLVACPFRSVTRSPYRVFTFAKEEMGRPIVSEAKDRPSVAAKPVFALTQCGELE